MSDQPRDDDELQALLAGTSALSHRYSELSDEQPPAHLDASILAASRSAVEPEKRRSSLRRSGSIWSSIWSRFSLMQWSVPMATAAVVIVAATLTLTIQRDPEIDRLYDKYDKPSSAMRERSETSSAATSEITTSGAVTRESVLASPKSSVPADASAPRRVPASPPTKAKERAFQKNEQRSTATRKRSDQSRQELAADRSGERDAAASVRANREANVEGKQKVIDTQSVVGKEQIAGQAQFLVEEQIADAPRPAEAFPDSDDVFAVNEPADVAAASAELSTDEIAITGAPASSVALDSLEAEETEELMKSTIETSPGRQKASTQMAESEPVVRQRFADEDSPSRVAKVEAVRNPKDWIEDIAQLLADDKRDEAIASLKKFRLEYPDYQLPKDLLPLLPYSAE